MKIEVYRCDICYNDIADSAKSGLLLLNQADQRTKFDLCDGCVAALLEKRNQAAAVKLRTLPGTGAFEEFRSRARRAGMATERVSMFVPPIKGVSSEEAMIPSRKEE
jgi:hypothetical protein